VQIAAANTTITAVDLYKPWGEMRYPTCTSNTLDQFNLNQSGELFLQRR
jgi:hypothetical protein